MCLYVYTHIHIHMHICIYTHIYEYKRHLLCVHVKNIVKTNFTAFSLSSEKNKIVALYRKHSKHHKRMPKVQMLNQINFEMNFIAVL